MNDVDSMYQRLDAVDHQLDELGLTQDSNYPILLRRIAGGEKYSAVRTLADVVLPAVAKGYSREKTQTVEPTALTPLNRMVDIVRPESSTARQFAALVDGFLASQPKPGTEAKIRAWLARWRDNDLNLQPEEHQSFLLQEVIPVSQNLSALGNAGMEALDYLDHGEPAPEAWETQQETLIQQANQPQAEVVLAIVPSVQKLIEAAAGTASSPAHAN